jgi:hypothetical protein
MTVGSISSAEDDDDDVLDDGNRSGRRESKGKSKLVNEKSVQHPSIPVSAIVAISLQSLLTIYLIYCGVSILLYTGEDPSTDPSIIWPFVLIRLLVALGVLIGMRHRKYIASKMSRGLCTLGLICGGVVIIYTLTTGVTSLPQYELLKIVSAQCLVWFALLACLGTKSAAKWFTE